MCFFKTTLSVLMYRLFVSFWFFLLRKDWLLLPVHGFRGLVLTGALGLLSWHQVKLCIVHGRFPAGNRPRKNHGPDRYPPSRKPLKPFRPFVCGVRAGVRYPAPPR